MPSFLFLRLTLPKLPTFHAAGLYFRRFQAGDELDWFDYLRQPEVVRLSGWAIASPAELEPLLSQAQGEPEMRFALADAANRLAGTIGFFDVANEQAELAYDLAPAWWGKGMATAACSAMCEWGLTELGLSQIRACVLADNRASARVLEKCGFVWEGMVQQARHLDGVVRNYRAYRRQRVAG